MSEPELYVLRLPLKPSTGNLYETFSFWYWQLIQVKTCCNQNYLRKVLKSHKLAHRLVNLSQCTEEGGQQTKMQYMCITSVVDKTLIPASLVHTLCATASVWMKGVLGKRSWHTSTRDNHRTTTVRSQRSPRHKCQLALVVKVYEHSTRKGQ